MRARKNINIILSVIILISAAYSTVTAFLYFLKNMQSSELLELLNTSAIFLTICALSYFVFLYKKLNIKFLFIPCVIFIANLFISVASSFITKAGYSNKIAPVDIYFLLYCCFGIISFILVAIDLKKGFLRSKFDIRILTTYWVIGTIASVGYVLGVSGNILGILYIIPSIFSPVFLLILILKYYQRDIENATIDGTNI